ncbi:MAG: TolB family protein [Candidatus Zixiibacteriota bacterium]
MKYKALLFGLLLVVACSKKSETQTASANNNQDVSRPLSQTMQGEESHLTPADTQPVILSQIESQAAGMKLPGKIAFWRGGQLYYMDANGTNQIRRNLVIQDGYGKISWAPDGERLAFAARGKANIEYPLGGAMRAPISDIFTTHIDSNHWYTQLTDNFGTSYPDWSKDGKSVWASTDLSANKFNNLFEPTYPNFQLFRFNFGRDTFTTNIYSLPVSGKIRAQALQPAVSPDGKRVALTLALTNVQGLPEVAGLVIVPAGEIKLGFRELMTEAGKRLKGYAASWSPDGKELAYVSTRDGNPVIYIMSADGSSERVLLRSKPDLSISTTAPGWSPDGKWLCFSSTNGGIYITSSDGKRVLQLTQTGSDFHPAWSPK